MREAHAHAEWERLRRAIRGEALPLALVDLEALAANAKTIASAANTAGKTIRVASKSVRSPALLQRIADLSEGRVAGIMAYAAGELPSLVAHGFRDVLVAYPTVQPSDLAHVIRANDDGASVSLAVDSVEHVDAIARAARDAPARARIPLVVDIDVSYRPARGVHIGVRRSPLRDVASVVALAERIEARKEVTFAGVMMYEAHLAGVDDARPVARAMKALARPRVLERRAAIVDALRGRGLDPRIVNGGGTGTVHANAREAALTEITAGSAYLASRLFDDYRGLVLQPAAFFALQVTRRPDADVVTCHGGGWIASGAAGKSRLPVPVFPAGLELLDLEGAGEVQTPLRHPRAVALAIGDPVFFRHAKAGELAEHVREYLLVRGESLEARVPTYRGLGLALLG